MEDSQFEENAEGISKTESTEESSLNNDKDQPRSACGVDKDLMVPKLSFFFYYMAMGAFLPYLGVYYKQLWLNARESGILLGIRPFMKMLCSPAWGLLTDYFHKPKMVLLLSIFGSMVAHWSQSIVSPFDLPCYVTNNTKSRSENVVPIMSRSVSEYASRIHNGLSHGSSNLWNLSYENLEEILNESLLKKYKTGTQKRRLPDAKKSSQDETDFPFEMKIKNNDFAEQSEKDFSGFYKDNNELANDRLPDSEHKAKLLQQETIQQRKTNNGLEVQSHPNHPFKIMIKNKKIKSPKPNADFRIRDNKKIYLILLVLIVFGELVAAPAPMLIDSGTLTLLAGKEHQYGQQRLFGSFGWGTGALFAGAVVTAFHKCPYSDNINYVPVFYVFAVSMLVAFIVTFFFKYKSQQSHDTDSESRTKKCIEGLVPFKNVKNAGFIFVLFFCGFLHSLKLSFLFWFLQDIGGTPILFTIILLINSLSEVLMFFVATYIVKKLGNDAVLYIGLWCYAVKYLLYSYIQHPWYVLPVEGLQGVTHGLVWTASVSYVTTGPGSGATIQGIIHGVYWGLGMAIGGVLGGFLIHVIGARTTFRLMTGCSLAILIGFYILNNLYERSHSGYLEISNEPSDKDSKKQQND